MDSARYNEYLRACREHGHHAYEQGEQLNHDEYSDACFQAAFEDGFKHQHERESELI